ncbi:MAG: hypothetical protein ILO53_06320 [Clostridia bacterium]|nr:hypothetical protein [Clostridia bacterium]
MSRYTLKVYPEGLGRSVYRIMEISGEDTLDTLCEFIVASFGLTDGHLYEFCMDNRMYSTKNYQSDPELDAPSTNIAIDNIGLVKGQKFALHYDFGDDWMFMIHVQKVDDESQTAEPELLRSVGDVGFSVDWDDWDDEEDDYY